MLLTCVMASPLQAAQVHQQQPKHDDPQSAQDGGATHADR